MPLRCLLLLLVAMAVAAVEAGPLRIVCFGDSITGNRPGEAYHQHYLKFSDLLQLLVEGRNGLGSCEVLNAGYAGDATEPRGDRPGALNRLESQLIAPQPDIAVILIGGNDAGGKIPSETTAANLDRIFAACAAAGIKSLALQYVVLADAEPGQAWVHLDDNNPLIAAAAARHGAALLDPGPAFAQALAAQGSSATLVDAKDRAHLRPGGELVLARSIFAKLDELGWLGPKEEQ